MFHFSHSSTLMADSQTWPIFATKEEDQELELDDTFEDDDFETDGKPPNKRPFLLILTIALIGGLLYFTLDLDLISSIGNMIVSPTKTSQGTQPLPQKTPPRASQSPSKSISAPTPRFSEGQRVRLSAASGSTTSMIRLLKDPEGTRPGLSVRVGESLTILDGAYINNRWVYQVTTQSGSSGWIDGQHLKKAHSS